MLKKKIPHLITLTTLLTPLNTHANTETWSAAIRASTIGIQGEVGYKFNKTFAVRLQAGGYDHYIKEIEYDKTRYHNIRYRPLVATFYADWYLLKCAEWFRASIGISYNHTKIRIHRDHRDDIFPTNWLIKLTQANYKYRNKIAPYAGFGFDFPIQSSSFAITFDAGLLYLGKTKVDLKISGIGQNNPQIMADARKKADKLINDIWWIKSFPVFSLGLKYRF